jgi:hypothetical protein
VTTVVHVNVPIHTSDFDVYQLYTRTPYRYSCVEKIEKNKYPFFVTCASYFQYDTV